jgi:hypothetical protein
MAVDKWQISIDEPSPPPQAPQAKPQPPQCDRRVPGLACFGCTGACGGGRHNGAKRIKWLERVRFDVKEQATPGDFGFGFQNAFFVL